MLQKEPCWVPFLALSLIGSPVFTGQLWLQDELGWGKEAPLCADGGSGYRHRGTMGQAGLLGRQQLPWFLHVSTRAVRLKLMRGNYEHPDGPKYSSETKAAEAASCFPCKAEDCLF